MFHSQKRTKYCQNLTMELYCINESIDEIKRTNRKKDALYTVKNERRIINPAKGFMSLINPF